MLRNLSNFYAELRFPTVLEEFNTLLTGSDYLLSATLGVFILFPKVSNLGLGGLKLAAVCDNLLELDY